MAATTSTSVNSSIANKTAIVLKSGYDSYMPMGDLIFNDTPPSRATEIFAISAHDGSFTAVGEGADFPSKQIVEVGSVSYTQTVYKDSVKITELMLAFDDERKVLREAYTMGYDAAIRRDQTCADVLINSFTTTLCWDGLSLCNNAGLLGATGQTQDNNLTGTLTDTSFNDAVVLLRKQKNHRGTNAPALPRFLVVPPDLGKKGWELLESSGNPEAANNNTNTNTKFGAKVVIWPLLTSATAWWLISDKPQHELHKMEKVLPEMQILSSLLTTHGGEEVRIQFALQAGAPDRRGVVGSNGTT